MKKDLAQLSLLIKRNVKIFLKDKASVFFSLLAPLIILMLYVLFLGKVQVSSLTSMFNEMNVSLDEKLVKSVVDSWMLAGVMAVSCITVSFSSQVIMIDDKQTGVVNDMLASPAKRSIISVSYFLYSFIVTTFICSVVLIVAFIYLAISGWNLSVADVFGIIGTTLLSTLSACLFSTVVGMKIKTTAAHGAIVGVLSASIGFLIGAYMPLSVLPKAVQYLILVIPGTYSAGLFRYLFMNGAIAKISDLSLIAANEIEEAYTVKINFFGTLIDVKIVSAIFAATVLLFIIIYIANEIITIKRNNFLNMNGGKKIKIK